MNQPVPGAPVGATPAMPEIYDLDMDQINHDAEQADKGNQFFDLVKGRTWVFFLPPWAANRRILGKPVYRSYLQKALGEKKTHVSYKTHESVPGSNLTGAMDPVVTVLNELKDIIGETEALKDSWPRCRYYSNVIVVATQEGDDLANLGPLKTVPPTVSILQYPKGVYDAIAKKIREIGGSIVHPASAVCVGINKTGKGLKTEYSVVVAGQESPTGFQAARENLFEKFGQEVMTEILQNLVDLDGIFKIPTAEQIEEAKQLAEQLRSNLAAGGGVGGAFAAPGGAMGMGSVAPPPVGQTAPGAVPVTPSVPGPPAATPPAAAPAAPAPPTTGQAPAGPPPTTTAPTAPGMIPAGTAATPPAPPPAG